MDTNIDKSIWILNEVMELVADGLNAISNKVILNSFSIIVLIGALNIDLNRNKDEKNWKIKTVEIEEASASAIWRVKSY